MKLTITVKNRIHKTTSVLSSSVTVGENVYSREVHLKWSSTFCRALGIHYVYSYDYDVRDPNMVVS